MRRGRKSISGRSTDYVAIGKPVSFYTIIEAARRRGEVAFGHRVAVDAGNRKLGGVVVNPPRHELRPICRRICRGPGAE